VKSRFLSEGYAANAVQHGGVVSVLDDDVTDEGCPFLVMDLLDGETIDARLVRYGTLSLEETCATAAGVLEVLAAAHAVGIVHRDIKPGNVFRTTTAQNKLLDFGIARVRELSPHSNMTEVGSTMGTPAYMPPEQARGDLAAVGTRSDVYALGAILYEILALTPPPGREGDPLAILLRVAEGRIDPPEKRAPARARGPISESIPRSIVRLCSSSS